MLPTSYFFTSALCSVRDFRAPVGGSIYPFFFAWWIGNIIYSHILLMGVYRNVHPNKKKQIAYFFLATAVGFTGGSLCYFPSFGVPIYPWGNFTVFLYPIIMAYAMLKYQLMEVRLFLRRAALLVGVYVVLLIVGFPLMRMLHSLAIESQRTSNTWVTTEVAVMSILLSFGPFLYAYLVRSRSYFKEHTMAGITHELKGPLATMENALDIFSKRIANKMDRDDLEYIAMLKNNQRRLSNSVNDLLAVYKVEGSSSLNITEIDPTEIIETVRSSFESQLLLKGISLQINVTTPKTFRADREKLVQILGNIMSNAIKFSDQGAITISIHSRERNIEFSVQDKGAGIVHQELPYVFDRFYQGKMKPKNQGTGIGLTIAKTWVEAHGGKIWAESEGKEKGATVTFTLPKDI
jgi:signal transduction histidine kinase